VIGGLFYFNRSKEKTPSEAITPVSENGNFKPDPSNATFTFVDGPITLSNGVIDRSVVPDSSVMEEISLLDDTAYGDINNDKKIDAVTLLARFGGGSGTFIYAGAFVSGPVNYKGSNVIFIGDRINPQSVSISDGIVTIKYLDRNPDQAFSEEPTIQKTMELIYSDGELKER